MIDVATEHLLDLRQACAEPALRNTQTGKPCHIAKLYRLFEPGATSIHGVRVKLETVRLPGGLRTSREAIARFVARLNGVTPPTAAPSKARRIERANRELAAAGVK